MLKVRPLGGVNFSSIEGENVTVYTRDGKEYTGLLACKSHSVHVFDMHALLREMKIIWLSF